METYKNIKKSTKIGLILSMIFVILGIGFMIFNLVSIPEPPAMPEGGMGLGGQQPAGLAPSVVPGWVRDCISLVLYLLTAFYAFIGHKKPHGNLLKYLFIAFSVSLILNVCTDIPDLIVMPCVCFAALIIAYVAGRLHKIEQNRILLVIAGVLLLPKQFLPLFSGQFLINAFFYQLTPLIILLALGFAYTARYEAHKAAGLADKADVEEK